MSSPKRVLVTGGTGFVGQAILPSLAKPYQVTATYRRDHPSTWGVDWIQIDAESGSPEELVARSEPDVIVHLLALSRTEICAKQPDLAKKINTEFTLDLAEAARLRGVRFLFTSTDQVFDGTKGNYSEVDPPSPLGSYARSKVEAEAGLAETFRRRPELLTIFRLALSYGHAEESHPGPVGWIVNSLKRGEPATLFMDENRSPLHVGDIGRAISHTIDKGHSGLYHLGGRDRIDRYAFGVRIAEKLGLPVDLCQARSVRDHAGPEPRSPDCSLNIAHFVETFGWTPIGIEEGIERLLKDTRA